MRVTSQTSYKEDEFEWIWPWPSDTDSDVYVEMSINPDEFVLRLRATPQKVFTLFLTREEAQTIARELTTELTNTEEQR